MNRIADKHCYSWFVLLALFLCFIFVPHLLRTMQHDEAFTYFYYAQSPISALFNYSAPNNHLLHSLLMWMVLQVMGTSVLAIRFIAFAFSLIMFALVWKLTMRLLDDIRVAMFAVLALGMMPVVAEHIVNGRGYTLSAVLALLYIDFIIRNPLRLRRSQRRTLVVLIFLNILTLPTMLILIASATIWVTYHGIKLRQFDALLSHYMDTIFASILGTLFYTSGLITGRINEFSDSFGYQTTGALVSDLLNITSSPVWNSLIFVGFVIGGIYFYMKQYHNLLLLLFLILIPLSLSFAQEWLTGGVLYPRTYVYLMPFIAIICMAGVAFIPKTYTPNIILFLCICAFSIGLWHKHQSLSRVTSTDLLLNVISNNAEDTDLLIIACCENYPIYYHFYVEDNQPRSASFERLVLIPSERMPFDRLISTNGLPSDINCEDTQWGTYSTHICEVPDYMTE